MGNSETQYISNSLRKTGKILEKLEEFERIKDMVFMTDEGRMLLKEEEGKLIKEVKATKNDNTSTVGLWFKWLILVLLGLIGIAITVILFFAVPIIGPIISGVIALALLGSALETREEIKRIKGDRHLVEKIYAKIDIVDNHIIFK